MLAVCMWAAAVASMNAKSLVCQLMPLKVNWCAPTDVPCSLTPHVTQLGSARRIAAARTKLLINFLRPQPPPVHPYALQPRDNGERAETKSDKRGKGLKQD